METTAAQDRQRTHTQKAPTKNTRIASETARALWLAKIHHGIGCQAMRNDAAEQPDHADHFRHTEG